MYLYLMIIHIKTMLVYLMCSQNNFFIKLNNLGLPVQLKKNISCPPSISKSRIQLNPLYNAVDSLIYSR
jgi:hypothetical protein